MIHKKHGMRICLHDNEEIQSNLLTVRDIYRLKRTNLYEMFHSVLFIL